MNSEVETVSDIIAETNIAILLSNDQSEDTPFCNISYSCRFAARLVLRFYLMLNII